MNSPRTLLVALLLAGASAEAALSSYTFGNLDGSHAITDGNPAGGVSSIINVSGMRPIVTGVNVIINVTGGYNGDLYAYLSYNGITVTLLNRVGTGAGGEPTATWGFATAGFNNVRLSHTGGGGGGAIHDTVSPVAFSPGGTSYTPDIGGGSSLAAFTGSNPNGNWTLFFADMAGGGGSSPSTLVSWGLEVTAVPEPVNVALGIFAGLGLAGTLWRTRARKLETQVAVAGNSSQDQR